MVEGNKKESFLPGLGNLNSLKEEEKMLKSYNQEFYSTLNSLKQTRFPLIHPNNCRVSKNKNQDPPNTFYEHHVNENASITSSIGQIFTTIEDAYLISIEFKKECIEMDNELKEMRKTVKDTDIIKDFKKYISDIRDQVQLFLVNQKTETFKLIKEIATLSKEKIDLQNKITLALEKIKKLEVDVGVKPNLFSISMDEAIKTYTPVENRFLEKDDY